MKKTLLLFWCCCLSLMWLGVSDVQAQGADLRVTKMASTSTPALNGQFTYTIVVTNLSTTTASFNPLIRDILPTGVTYVMHTQSGGTYNASTGLWAIPSIPAGSSRMLMIYVRRNTTNGFQNCAMSMPNPSGTQDPNSGNNQSCVITPPLTVATPDIQVMKTVSNQNPNIGDVFNWTISVRNIGQGVANNVSVTDNLPAGLQLVSTSATQGSFAGNTWNVGTLNAGAPAATLTIQVRRQVATAITNCATGTATGDTNTNNNNSCANINPCNPPASPDIKVEKIIWDLPSGGNVALNGTFTYKITVTNIGQGAASSVSVTDQLPSGVQFISAQPSQGSISGSNWNVGNVAVGGMATLMITVRRIGAEKIINCAEGTATGDTNTGNNQGCVTLPPVTPTCTGGRTWNGSQCVCSTGSNWNGSQCITCTGGQTWNGWDCACPSGQTLINGQCTTTCTGGRTWNGSQCVCPTGSNWNGSSCATLSPDIKVEKIIWDLPSGGNVALNGTFTYKITVTNIGQGAASSVSVTDQLPSGVQFISAQPSQGSISGSNWNVGNVAVGGMATLMITVRRIGAEKIINCAEGTATGDTNTGNNQGCVTLPPVTPTCTGGRTWNGSQCVCSTGSNWNGSQCITCTGGQTWNGWDCACPSGQTLINGQCTTTCTGGRTWNGSQCVCPSGSNWNGTQCVALNPDIKVEKTVSPANPALNSNFTYSITVTNIGQGVANNVVVVDNLPAGVQWNFATSGNVGNWGGNTWSVGTLQPGASATLTLGVTRLAANAIENCAEGSATGDTNTTNNRSCVTIPTTTPTCTGGQVLVNGVCKCPASTPVWNGWDCAACPSGSNWNGNSCVTCTGGQTWNGTQCVCPSGSNWNGSSCVTCSGGQTWNGSSCVGNADLEIKKEIWDLPSGGNVNLNDTFTYKITLTNIGQSTATGMMVTDQLPAGVQLINSQVSAGTFALGLWKAIPNLAPGASVTLMINVKRTGSQPIVNCANIISSSDVDTTNNQSCVTLPPVTTTCTGGQVWNGQSCVCPSGQNWNGSQCIGCQGGQTWNGQSCVCPSGQTWNGSQCIGCQGGQTWNGQSCVCPSGQNWNGSQCVACPSGQTWNGQSCVCPSGTTWNGNQCVVQQCTGGQVWNGSTCQCPMWTWWNNATQTCECEASTVWDPATQMCAARCKGGAWWNGSTNSCECPSGQIYSGGQCVLDTTGGSTQCGSATPPWRGAVCCSNGWTWAWRDQSQCTN